MPGALAATAQFADDHARESSELNPAVHADLRELLRGIIHARRLHAVFQPIISNRAGDIIGYEGLIRGPADSPLHMPGWLFEVARRNGLADALERVSREIVAECFVSRQLKGKLFLNVSPDVIAQSADKNGELIPYLRKIGLAPERIIIEVTENQRVIDLATMREAVVYYRSLGFEVAIDDLGEGFSSLRLWSELRPEFVKIDKHFIHDVSKDSLKLEFVRAIQQIAGCCGSRVIAEGIETRQDFRVVRDMGIAYGQGFLIGRPSEQPACEIEGEASLVIQSEGIAVYPGLNRLSAHAVKARKLLIEVDPVTADTENDTVYARFDASPELMSLPVVTDGIPVGLIHRYTLIDRFARPFRRELYGRKPCSMFVQVAPLIVDQDLGIQELSALLASGDPRHIADGFVITENGRYLGIGNAADLLREVTQMQILAARYANPLTLLPGNVPIAEHADRLLGAGIIFYVCYCDIDNFKPFNDVYGYQKGDEIIRLLAHLLAGQCDPERDFLGHIGGDDFILMFQSADWEARCRAALDEFGRQVPLLMREADRARGGIVTEDRRGQTVLHPIPTLSIGVVAVHPSDAATHLDVSAAAAEAKRQAKRIDGNTLFIERRRVFG